MKINKILAAGVAATLAVTSLSAVASAEVKSIEFPMDYTVSGVSWKGNAIQWLDDNNYIGGAGYGANLTARQIINDIDGKAARVTDWIVAYTTATGVANAPFDGTGVFVANAATTALPAMATVKGNEAGVAAGPAIGAAMTADLTAIQNSINAELALAELASKAIATKSVVGVEEATYSAEKCIGDAKALAGYYYAAADKALAGANKIKKLDTTTFAGAAGAATYLENVAGYFKNFAGFIDEYVATAEDALLGAPIVQDKERGGIWINTTQAFKLPDGRYAKITGASIKITGTKRGSTANESYTGDFVPAYTKYGADHLGDDTKDANGNYLYRSGLYLVFGPRYVNRLGYVNLNVFGTITGVELDVDFDLTDANGNKLYFYSEADYNAVKKVIIKDLKNGSDIRYLEQFNVELDVSDVYSPLAKAADYAGDKYWTPTWVKWNNYEDLDDHTTNLYKMYRALANSTSGKEVDENSNSKVTKYSFVYKTQDTGAIIYRQNVAVMSVTGDWKSQNQVGKFDGNQTYYDSGLGTNPNEFGGLASQVADFFNKQNNGQIIMHFIDPAKVTLWTSNGIPSTEVGLRTALAQTAFALFFNYNESTGSIQTIGTVDKDALTVTFDLEDVLDDFGGLTKANLHDIYYGCNNGLTYGDPYWATGFAVDKVTLQYDNAPAAVDATTDDDTADDAAVVVADDDDDDDIAADDDIIEDDDDDDDDAGEIIADDDDDDDDVNNEVDYVDGDDDANPGTGVGLAVIPAIVAAAAVAVSKKRK